MELWTETKHKPNTEVRVQNAPRTQSLRVPKLKNEFVQTKDSTSHTSWDPETSDSEIKDFRF